MARERREAAYNVEIEKAIDEVRRCRSGEWFCALLHQNVLRSVGSGGPRGVTDEQKAACPGPGDAGQRDRAAPPRRGFGGRIRAWAR